MVTQASQMYRKHVLHSMLHRCDRLNCGHDVPYRECIAPTFQRCWQASLHCERCNTHNRLHTKSKIEARNKKEKEQNKTKQNKTIQYKTKQNKNKTEHTAMPKADRMASNLDFSMCLRYSSPATIPIPIEDRVSCGAFRSRFHCVKAASIRSPMLPPFRMPRKETLNLAGLHLRSFRMA
jgi:hypothetical protein